VSEKTGRDNPTLSFKLDELQHILYAENAIIDESDVPALLVVLLESKKLYVPGWLKRAHQDARFCGDMDDAEDPEDDDGSQVFCSDNTCDQPECHRCFPRANCDRHEKCRESGSGPVTCKLCGKDTPAATAHLHQHEWVGECCWDDRLKTTE